MGPPHDSHFSHKLLHHNRYGGLANARADNHLVTILEKRESGKSSPFPHNCPDFIAFLSENPINPFLEAPITKGSPKEKVAGSIRALPK